MLAKLLKLKNTEKLRWWNVLSWPSTSLVKAERKRSGSFEGFVSPSVCIFKTFPTLFFTQLFRTLRNKEKQEKKQIVFSYISVVVYSSLYTTYHIYIYIYMSIYFNQCQSVLFRSDAFTSHCSYRYLSINLSRLISIYLPVSLFESSYWFIYFSIYLPTYLYLSQSVDIYFTLSRVISPPLSLSLYIYIYIYIYILLSYTVFLYVNWATEFWKYIK